MRHADFVTYKYTAVFNILILKIQTDEKSLEGF